MHDLCPYTCPFENCTMANVLYITRETWSSHIKEDHSLSTFWECLVCDDGSKFREIQDFETHVAEYHRDTITFSDLTVLGDMSLRRSSPELTACPLCNWAYEQTMPPSQDTLLEHIAEHIHSFSLRSLPWATEVSEHEQGRFAHSARKVNQWLSIEDNEIPPYKEASEVVLIDNYFMHNDYFAESVGVSSNAQTPSSVSDRTLGKFADWDVGDES